MKVLMKPIEMIAWFKSDTYPIPLRFRLEGEDKFKIVIKLDKVETGWLYIDVKVLSKIFRNYLS